MEKTIEPSTGISVMENPVISKRRYERRVLNAVRGYSAQRGKTPIRLVDFSETGAAVEYPASKPPVIGQSVVLRIPALPDRKEKNVLLRGVVRSRRSPTVWGVQFEELLSEQIARKNMRANKQLAVVAALLLAVIITILKIRNVVSFWYGPLLQIYSLGAATYVLSRVLISMFYRRPADRNYTPSVSLIVAVKNEEAHIADTVKHCFGSRYPADKLEVIVVDDGSTDKTWDVLTGLQKEYARFRALKFPKNRGKRHAMAQGMRIAQGDFFIFIDSDTFLEEEAIYRLVQPFADPRVAAVAGHTHMIVEKDNIISKMEAVRYFISQRVMKAAESVFNAVTCCPGPLSGYRKSQVLPILDRWENQQFLGTPATFGDDRSLTNFVLRHNRVVYHAGAGCWTYAPSTLPIFIKQQLRWKKSWLREFTIAMRFMWKKHPIAAVSYYMSVVITLVSPLIVFFAMFGFVLFGMPFNFFGYVSGLLLVYAFLGLVYYYHTRSRYWAYGMIFAILYLFIFSFQNYYAMLTVNKNKWGTR
jgi:hyaluronan synthase